jgi:uncharacterized protein (DUF1501 family)
MSTSRRQFLRAATALGAATGGRDLALSTGLAGLAALASQRARAADTGNGYRALVCLYLAGGNDSHNWVVPTDSTGYAEYAGARKELAWAATDLHRFSRSGQADGRTFGMPTALQPLQRWYESGQMAVVANVGTLSRPTTKSDFLAGLNLPIKLFSHNDQASTWQSLQPEGAPTGWGGRMGDILSAANRLPVFTSISASGNAVFLSGAQVTQYQVGLDGPVRMAALNKSSTLGSTTVSQVLQLRLAQAGNDPWQAAYAGVTQRSAEVEAVLSAALAASPVPDIPATPITLGNGTTITLDQDSLARQLRIVARMIRAGQGLGLQRQVFMVSMGGFDSHANQMRDQPSQMARVAQSSDYFLSALAGLGLLNNVTLFTASDFGRTLSSNGAGCDHGWGSHHFVAGGAVKGTQIYGRFPVTALGTEDDMGSGRLLPGNSVTEYAAAMGRWMGLSPTELRDVLPTLGNFSQAGTQFL